MRSDLFFYYHQRISVLMYRITLLRGAERVIVEFQYRLMLKQGMRFDAIIRDTNK